ncbi:MAG TPA: UDP-N-acetylmuramoyl-L-alanyl-D-glutamate--2,6-diaminopimelate ligase [Candidatus Paceibacterota bacterium]|nr:UDP-N-acetylmuramoyl-L-alanyl-D-glutamate--2,6-diaminopimelate ligase [Candidatus Paceibacterota bacterium]HPT40343.1 UDP-N-acetylmuramoyl-L-alanyl-D-glutamate--2,6-diaminopimelate ligase [Candidatus Paceibacterota bacterium]
MIYQIKKFIKKITPDFIISFYHYCLVFIGAMFYGFPGKNFVIIGITGTKGKTTVAELLNSFLESMGKKTAVANSLRFKVGEKSWPNNLKMTMPGRLFLQKFLFHAKKKHCQYVILEVTSEGIKQHRHQFIDFDVAALVNVQPEHLEAHDNSFEKYRQAKERLFAKLNSCRKKMPISDRRGQFEAHIKKISVVNLDDKLADNFLNYWAEKKIGFCLNCVNKNGVDVVVKPDHYQSSNQGIDLRLDGVEMHSPLKGDFNLENILCAIAIAKSLNVPLMAIKESLAKFDGLPGRMEEIETNSDFKVFVDYAHTPDSLEAVCSSLKKEVKEKSKLICILGSTGGGRDKWKRPAMGKVVSQFCDEIIITNEDPYDEDPRRIMEDVAVGVKLAKKNPKMIENRRDAIRTGLRTCSTGDILVITGKGSEQVMVVKNGEKIPWDDRKVVKEELKSICKE